MRQRDKSDLPLLVLSYKYFLLEYSFSTLSFLSQKSTFLGGGITQRLKELQQRPFFTNPQIFDLLPCEEMAINFVVPVVSLLPFLLHFYCTPVHSQSVLAPRALFLFVLLFTPKNF